MNNNITTTQAEINFMQWQWNVLLCASIKDIHKEKKSNDTFKNFDTQYFYLNLLIGFLNSKTKKTIVRSTVCKWFSFVTDPFKAIKFTYDANGNRLTVTDPDNLTTRYTFDELNRVSDVTNIQGATNYHYDRSSLKTRVSYPNGSEIRTSYDGARRTKEIRNLQNTAVVSEYNYTYDDNGNRTEQIETNGSAAETTAYTYDNNDRLLTTVYSDVTTVYTYDATYNRKTEITTGNTGVVVDKSYN